jgi:hypothetical protein
MFIVNKIGDKQYVLLTSKKGNGLTKREKLNKPIWVIPAITPKTHTTYPVPQLIQYAYSFLQCVVNILNNRIEALIVNNITGNISFNLCFH